MTVDGVDLRRRLSAIEVAIFDFDGIMTDGFVYVDAEGRETVRCSRRDGLGIRMLVMAGVEVMVVSQETNPVVAMRCKKLGIACYQGVDHKARFFNRTFLGRLGRTLYMGDDINDLECIKLAGVGVSVADGHPECRMAATYVTQRSGGNDAVREVCDLILEARKE